MKKIFTVILLPSVLLTAFLASWTSHAGETGDKAFVNFRMQELPEKLSVGYAVLLVDVNGDGKPDIVVVDTTRVIWFENPTWKMHTIISGLTKPDNVCIDAYDIDGDGQLDFALGADWKPFNTSAGGTLQWLKRGKTLDEPWTVYPIDTEPTIHRIRFADIDGNGKKALISVPLMGRGSSAKNNWVDGSPLRVTAYRIPKEPTKDRWLPEVLDESLHVGHNFHPIDAVGRKGQDILTASYEGVNLLSMANGKWDTHASRHRQSRYPEGQPRRQRDQAGQAKKWPQGHRHHRTLARQPGRRLHGTPLNPPLARGEGGLWDRHVIDEELRWGHAVSCADLDGDGDDEIIIGVRDDPKAGEKVTDRRGVRIYKVLDAKGEMATADHRQWRRRGRGFGGRRPHW